MRIAVNVSHLDENMMNFFGYILVRQSSEFRVYRDRYNEDRIVTLDDPFVFTDNEFDADAMRSNLTIRVDED